jgi:hypothetical protein
MIVSTMALPEELHRRLAVAALEDRIAMTEVVRRALGDWLDRRDKARARKGER